LNVTYLAILKDDLHVGIRVDFLRAQINDPARIAKGRGDLID
jgi:hypothetical protein